MKEIIVQNPTLIVNNREIKHNHSIMNEAPEGFKIIATVFDYSIHNIKKEIADYTDSKYTLYYYSFSVDRIKRLHSIRVLLTDIAIK